MAVLNTLFIVIATILALLIGAFFFRDIVVPLSVYIYHYFTHGRLRAEDEALDAAGENKGSYIIKDQLKKNRLVNIEPVNSFQDGVGETVGSAFEKGGVAEGVGKSFGTNAQSLQEDGPSGPGEGTVNSGEEMSEDFGDAVTPAGPRAAAGTTDGVGKAVDGAFGIQKI